MDEKSSRVKILVVRLNKWGLISPRVNSSLVINPVVEFLWAITHGVITPHTIHKELFNEDRTKIFRPHVSQ